MTSTNDKPTIQVSQNNLQEKKERLTFPLQEKLVIRLRINPWLSWLILGEILGGSAYLAVILSHGTMTWIGQLAFMYAIVFMIAGAGPIWVRDELERLLPAFYTFIKLPKNKTKEWFTNELIRIFSTRGMLISGIIFSVLAMWSFIGSGEDHGVAKLIKGGL